MLCIMWKDVRKKKLVPGWSMLQRCCWLLPPACVQPDLASSEHHRAAHWASSALHLLRLIQTPSEDKPFLFCTNWGMSDVLERFCSGELLCGFKEETSLMRINWGEFGSSCLWSWAFRSRLSLLYELSDLKKKKEKNLFCSLQTDYSAF